MRLATLTSGGDCPGLNAAIRSIVRTANAELSSTVIGYEDGWLGLIEDRKIQLYDDEHIDKILLRGGTMLGTGRVDPAVLKASLDQIRDNLDDAGVDALIPIGGDGTLRGAKWLADNGIPVVGVPKAIDNDVSNTDSSFGFDSAVAVAADAVDRLHTTAESHNRVMIVEVMGRQTGWIALNAGMAGGAHYTIIPEYPYDIEEVCQAMERRFQMGERYGIIVVAEGARPKDAATGVSSQRDLADPSAPGAFTGVGHKIAADIHRKLGHDVRTTVLGHMQRGGSPTTFDRILATRYGIHAARACHERNFGTMTALRGEQIQMIPLADAVAEPKRVPLRRYRTATALFG